MAKPIFIIGVPDVFEDEASEMAFVEEVNQASNFPDWHVLIVKQQTTEITFQAFNPYQVDESQLEEFKKWLESKK